jgi:hypothetical protein
MSELEDRVAAAATAAPLNDLSPAQRAELDALLVRASALEDLPGMWQAAVLEAELRAAGGEPAGGGEHCH